MKFRVAGCFFILKKKNNGRDGRDFENYACHKECE